MDKELFDKATRVAKNIDYERCNIESMKKMLKVAALGGIVSSASINTDYKFNVDATIFKDVVDMCIERGEKRLAEFQKQFDAL